MSYDETIEVVQLEEQPILSMTFWVAPASIGEKLKEALPAIYQFIVSNGVAFAGQPLARYHEMKDGQFHLEAGIPVATACEGADGIEASTLPGGRALKLQHFGPYEKLGDAHDALCRYATTNQFQSRGAPWEIYVTDPGEEPNQEQWLTELYMPIEP